MLGTIGPQDFIPQEELAKLLAKSGSETAKAQAAALEEAQKIQADNVGHRMLQAMGWREGQGLGASASGIAAPIAAAAAKQPIDKGGLGARVFPLATAPVFTLEILRLCPIGHFSLLLCLERGVEKGALGARGCPLATTPVSALKVCQSIVRLQAANDIQEDDDEFEAYRKRMMLGYKHRYVCQLTGAMGARSMHLEQVKVWSICSVLKYDYCIVVSYLP